MDRITIVSTDGHAGCSVEGYRDYLDPEYRDLLDGLIAQEEMFRMGMAFGRMQYPDIELVGDRGQNSLDGVSDLYFDVGKRLAELDDQGIAADFTVIGTEFGHPFFTEFNRPYPADVRAAGARAHNRWLADIGAESGGRLLLNGESGPCTDMTATLAELQWLAERRFVSVSLPGLVADPDLPPLTSEYFEPFWSACEDLGLVVQLHAGWGEPQGTLMGVMDNVMSGKVKLEDVLDASNPESPFALNLTSRRPLWQLMLGGVFDRHPKLRLGLIEVRADWIPATLAYLDRRCAGVAPRLKMKPSEYWRQHCHATPSAPHRAEVEHRHEIGVGNFLFGADIPHPESTWPNTLQWLQAAFEGVPEDEARMILGGNAIRIYGLDRAGLDAIAAKIGPTPAEVLGGADVSDALLDNFERRAGYLKPLEDVDTSRIEELLVDDLAATAVR